MENMDFCHHCSKFEVSTSALNDASICDLPRLSRSAKFAFKYLGNQYFKNKYIVPFQNVRATLYRKNKSVTDPASNGRSWN
jgi:hypothetical protein